MRLLVDLLTWGGIIGGWLFLACAVAFQMALNAGKRERGTS